MAILLLPFCGTRLLGVKLGRRCGFTRAKPCSGDFMRRKVRPQGLLAAAHEEDLRLSAALPEPAVPSEL